MDHTLQLHFQPSTAVAERGRVTELIPNDRTNYRAVVNSDQQQQQGHKLLKHEMRKPPTKLNHRRRVPLQKSDYYNGNGDGSNSGMRAFFLVGGSGYYTSAAAGTGVFLPYRGRCTSSNNNSTESRRKPRCSTVLIPSRVTQALMLHFQKMGGSSSTLLQQGIAEGRNIGVMNICPNNGMIITHQPPSSSSVPNLDNYNDTAYLRLPEEWIY